MKNTPPTSPSNEQIADALKPLYPILSDLVQTAMDRVIRGVTHLGMPRPVERAGDMHRAIRECLRPICDQCPEWLELTEEPEGKSMDYVSVTEKWTDHPLVLRWGRIKDGKISRNGTRRSVQTRATGYLFGDFDEKRNDLPMVTLTHTIEDDYTEVGVPQWWVGRITLVRERLDASEFIAEVASFSQPEKRTQDEYDAPLVRARELDAQRWGDMIERLRGEVA